MTTKEKQLPYGGLDVKLLDELIKQCQGPEHPVTWKQALGQFAVLFGSRLLPSAS